MNWAVIKTTFSNLLLRPTVLLAVGFVVYFTYTQIKYKNVELEYAKSRIELAQLKLVKDQMGIAIQRSNDAIADQNAQYEKALKASKDYKRRLSSAQAINQASIKALLAAKAPGSCDESMDLLRESLLTIEAQ